MREQVLVGIDAGTSVIKAVAFSADGQQLAMAARPNSYVTLPDGGVEQDMRRTWIDTAATLKELGETIPNLAERLIAIAVTGQGDGMWLIDQAGEPVAPAWLWLDARAGAIVSEFCASPDYDLHYERTGTGVNVCQQSVQLAWMARHRPEVLARAATAFHCKDWLYFKLTDARATDPSEANFTFGNYKSRTYQSDILDALGAGEAKRLLPPIVEGTAVSHRLSAEAASLTGLKAGTPVALGYVDVICTGLGGGLFDATGKSGCTIVGSTGMHMKLVADPAQVRLNTERSGYTMAFPAPDKVAQIQSNMASTLNIDWLIDMGRGLMADHGLQKSRADMLAGLDQHISAAQPARLLFHPYISLAGERGPFMEPAARAMLTGLEIGVGYHDLMRAVFEGLAFAARDCYATMGDIPTEVRLTGGASRSAQLRLIHASVLNAPVRTVTREEAGAAGAAMMAAVQQQLYPDMQACAAQWVDPWLGPSTRPDTALAEIYDRAFPIYRATRVAMRPQWQAHHALKRTVQ